MIWNVRIAPAIAVFVIALIFVACSALALSQSMRIGLLSTIGSLALAAVLLRIGKVDPLWRTNEYSHAILHVLLVVGFVAISFAIAGSFQRVLWSATLPPSAVMCAAALKAALRHD